MCLGWNEPMLIVAIPFKNITGHISCSGDHSFIKQSHSMIIYTIDNLENKKTSEGWHYKDIVLFESKGIPRNLCVDFKFMIDKYGFSLSDSEIDQFHIHYFMWSQFYDSNESLCFIVENLKQLNFHISDVLNSATTLFQNNSEWDIYFPFDPEEENNGNFEFGYILGYRWGAEGYFLKRSAAKKLLDLNSIGQSVDEEIIRLSAEGQFEISYGKAEFFTLIRNSVCILSRNKIKKTSIFNINVWTELEKSKVKEILAIISSLASLFNIDIVLSYGSLLGQIRHGGIMSWDDDIDLAVNKKSWSKLSTALMTVNELKFDIFQWGKLRIPYVKVWLSQSETIPGFRYSFPFVDIWFYEDESKEIVFDDGKKYLGTEFYPFQNTTFEGSIFKMPFKPIQFLDKTYPDWKNKIQIYPWSHKFEKNYFLPLSTSISVDEQGRLNC